LGEPKGHFGNEKPQNPMDRGRVEGGGADFLSKKLLTGYKWVRFDEGGTLSKKVVGFVEMGKGGVQLKGITAHECLFGGKKMLKITRKEHRGRREKGRVDRSIEAGNVLRN